MKGNTINRNSMTDDVKHLFPGIVDKEIGNKDLWNW